MNSLFIINDSPYGTQRAYNALRLALALLNKEAQTEVVVFLFADAVIAARAGQKTPDGYYNIERMLKEIPGILHMSVDPLPTAHPSGEMWANTGHPVSPEKLAFAVGAPGNMFNDHGMRWDNSGKNGLLWIVLFVATVVMLTVVFAPELNRGA